MSLLLNHNILCFAVLAYNPSEVNKAKFMNSKI